MVMIKNVASDDFQILMCTRMVKKVCKNIDSCPAGVAQQLSVIPGTKR